jgi:hypothetical protein
MQTVKEVLGKLWQDLPRRERVISQLLKAALANETKAHHDRRDVLSLTEKNVALQISKYEEDGLKEQALHNEVDIHTTRPPLCEVEWRDHISKFLLHVVRCIISCFETGYRDDAVKFYRGAGVFDPLFGKSISVQEGQNLIDNLK